jgi:hypothetical protein
VYLGAAIPDLREEGIIGTERPDKFDSSYPSSGMIEDEKAPASIVPADLRPGQVNRAVCELSPGPMPEKRTGVRQFFKDALVIEEFMLVRIYRYGSLLAGIIVVDQEVVLPVLFPDLMDVPELIATFPALEAFESQSSMPP